MHLCPQPGPATLCFWPVHPLQKALLEEDYARLLPPLDVQRLQYNLDPEIVYCAYRPTLKRLLFLTAPLPEDGELEEGEEAPPASGERGNGGGGEGGRGGGEEAPPASSEWGNR